jgi:hypothetical protein
MAGRGHVRPTKGWQEHRVSICMPRRASYQEMDFSLASSALGTLSISAVHLDCPNSASRRSIFLVLDRL